MLQLNPLVEIPTIFSKMVSGPTNLGAMLSETCDYIAGAALPEPQLTAMKEAIWVWDNEDTSTFAGKSPALSRERREEIYARLGLGGEEIKLFDAKFDPALPMTYLFPSAVFLAPSKTKLYRRLRKNSDNVVTSQLTALFYFIVGKTHQLIFKWMKKVLTRLVLH